MIIVVIENTSNKPGRLCYMLKIFFWIFLFSDILMSKLFIFTNQKVNKKTSVHMQYRHTHTSTHTHNLI